MWVDDGYTPSASACFSFLGFSSHFISIGHLHLIYFVGFLGVAVGGSGCVCVCVYVASYDNMGPFFPHRVRSVSFRRGRRL